VKYAIDTSILVDHLHNYRPAVELVNRLLADDAQLNAQAARPHRVGAICQRIQASILPTWCSQRSRSVREQNC
jgi:hypothetical protein